MKIGLALGSGSARGWSHIGVIKALKEKNIEPDIVCGTSIGALVGAAYCTEKLDDLETWVTSLTKYQLARFFEINTTFNGFVDVDKLFEFFHKHVATNDKSIEDLSKTFACVATQLHSGREVWFSEGNLHEAIQASMAMPGLFPPVERDNTWLVDGGLVNPVPISLCRALGAEIVIAVNLNGDLVQPITIEKNTDTSSKKDDSTIAKFIDSYAPSFFKKTNKKNGKAPTVFNAIASSINIAQDRITKSRMAGDPADILLTPKLKEVGLLDFYMAKEAIKEGKESVWRMSEQIESIFGPINEK